MSRENTSPRPRGRFPLADSCSLQTIRNMFSQNPYLGLASQRRLRSPLWIAAWVMALGLVGCAHKAKTRLTEVEVAKPVRTDVPIYLEWIGTTVGYIDAQIHFKVTGYLLVQDPPAFSLPTATETQALSQQRHTSQRSKWAHPDTNPIVPRGGFLQVAVSEAALNSVSTPSSSLASASD